MATYLVPLEDGIWCLDGHFVTWGCKGSIRMTVVQDEAGLVLYSPVAMDPEAVTQIRALGNVSTLIAPNLFHHFYLRACADLFPAASIVIPHGLEDKIGPVAGAMPMANWQPGPDIATLTVEGHRLNETVLFHRPSGTLVTADLLYNLQAEHHTAEKLFFRSIGCYGRPSVAFYHRFAIKDKAAFRRTLTAIQAWPIRRIIMSHGRVVEGDGAGQILELAWKHVL